MNVTLLHTNMHTHVPIENSTQLCGHIIISSSVHTFAVYTQNLECKSNIRGGNYAGSVSTTKGGLRCQHWDSQRPHRHEVTDDLMPDGSLAAAENLCRSPDFDPGGPWCFTTDPQVKWDYCDVPTCSMYI